MLILKILTNNKNNGRNSNAENKPWWLQCSLNSTWMDKVNMSYVNVQVWLDIDEMDPFD